MAVGGGVVSALFVERRNREARLADCFDVIDR